MAPLPFKLRVPGYDGLDFTAITSKAYQFRGQIRLNGANLVIEWRGSAKIDTVGWGGIKSETLPLPTESISIRLDELQTIRLGGGWFRPYLELGGYDLDALNIIPGEEEGRVRFWLARLDVPASRELVSAIAETRLALKASSSDVDTPQHGAV